MSVSGEGRSWASRSLGESARGPVMVLEQSRFTQSLAVAHLSHGFLGQPLNFGSSDSAESYHWLQKATGSRAVFTLQQEHGNVCLVRESKDFAGAQGMHECGRADAMLVRCSSRKVSQGPGILIGVRAADCMPILLRAGEFVGIIHAGWRGLAEGIVENALSEVQKLTSEPAFLVVGPCAGGEHYEVGPEVLAQLGPDVVARESGRKGKHLLNLFATLERRLSGSSHTKLSQSNICTLSDPAWHSFRRDGKSSGRNLGFIRIP